MPRFMPKFGTMPKELEDWQQDEKTLQEQEDRFEELARQYPGRYVALVEDEVFAAESVQELLELVREQHPEAQPSVRYIPEQSAQNPPRQKKNPARRDDVYL